ncbi:MAG: hypothetical protein BroJett005_08420 [Ignavibacteriota bacterium]|nr:MAG: hypothetical protein BroJett005_08420 [Ignavibacteriota bacterium]
MAKIITYKSPLTGNSNQCFCQMKFDDGLKILISQSREGIKIFRLFIGSIPTKTLFQANFSERDKHKIFLEAKTDSSLLLDSYVETIKSLKTSKQFFDLINN